jgi:oligoribonuclease NrnB/cAMP/cGMP phosphodiesterase (DHH superfamily)
MDGAASALAAWLKFGDDAEYRPAAYGDAAPTDDEVRGRDVFVLDFSYPRAEIMRLREAINPEGCFVVCDHHKTAAADLEGLSFCHFDMNKSGAALAWDHFSYSVEKPRVDAGLPELFAYVQDRDLWRWELPFSREVSVALDASGAKANFRELISIYEQWSWNLGHRSKDCLIRDGCAILRAQAQLVAQIAATAEEVEIPYLDLGDGFFRASVRALAVCSAILQSEVGEALALESAQRERDAVGVVYYRDGRVGKWKVSLRSRDVDLDLSVEAISDRSRPATRVFASDVSVVAKSYGGGGHRQAAAFGCDELPWWEKGHLLSEAEMYAIYQLWDGNGLIEEHLSSEGAAKLIEKIKNGR